MVKWICARCGRETVTQPRKNEICNKGSCKGRLQRYAQCKKCGRWFQAAAGRTFCGNCNQRKIVGKVDVVCSQCGKHFKRYNSNVNGKTQFCNIECLREYEKTKWERRTCKECGREFKVYRSAMANTNASGSFCSKACYDKSKRIKGSSKYKGNFGEIKRLYFSGQQFCAICGTKERIHIHHIIPYRLTQDNGIDNLVPLCISHHKKFENATLSFIKVAKDLCMAKLMINNIIRARQQDTMNAILESNRRGGGRNVSQNS